MYVVSIVELILQVALIGEASLLIFLLDEAFLDLA